MPDAAYWRSDDLATEPGFHSWQHTFVSRTRLGDAALDDLLGLVVQDMTDDVIVVDSTLGWLYHPYDGGADLIAGYNLRHRLITTHPEWCALGFEQPPAYG